MLSIGISFDDSLVDQLKWARTMAQVGLRGVFYVSPGVLGTPALLREGKWFLTEDHVRRIAEGGHVVGNHTWEHEAPATHLPVEVLASACRAAEWLDALGWEGSLLALPYGVRGGKWDDAILAALAAEGFVLRDVRFDGEAAASLPAALESTALVSGEDVDLRYFHGNHNTSDDDMARFLYHVAEEVSAGRARLVLPRKGETQWLPSQ